MRLLLLPIVLVCCALICGDRAAAGDRDRDGSYSSYYTEKMLADMERQRREQEKALQAAIKAMQEAQKAAIRNAQRAQAEAQARAQAQAQQAQQAQQAKAQAEAQARAQAQAQARAQAQAQAQAQAKAQAQAQSKVQTQTQAQTSRPITPTVQTTPTVQKNQAPATPATNTATQRNDKTPDKTTSDDDDDDDDQKGNKAKSAAGALDADADDDDDAPDYFLNDAEIQMRAIEKARHRAVMQAAREQQILREKELARAERIRERTVKRILDAKNNGAGEAPTPAPGKAPPQIVKAPPQLLPVAADPKKPASDNKNNPPQKQAVEQGKDWLDSYQRKASGLGMGPEAIKKTIAQAKQDGDKGLAPIASDDAAGGKTLPGKSVKVDAAGKVDAVVRAGGALDARRLEFPGKELGAELPVKMFEAERANELLSTGISAVDKATAEAHGFVVSPPVELKGVGKTVQRIRAPDGVVRDEAERELHKILPFLSVTPNQAHNIFLGSLGETERATGTQPPGGGIDRRAVSPASSQPCPHQTCFGSDLIKWKSTLGSCAKGVRIGIIDTSFDVGHPALQHISVEQGEFLDGKPPSPYDWHGTAVLSLLAGDPTSGTPGLVPDATFLLATAFRSDAAGNASTDTVRLLAALAWLEGLDVDIVNMSFSGPRDEAIMRAIARMSEKGIVFIAAAGNGGPIAAPSYPAAYPSVIAVTAVNRDGENYRNANRGNYIDVAAPGVDVLTALPDAKQGYRTGTSFAAPFVTAIVATRGPDIGFVNAKSQFLREVSTRDLGPPGRDPIYGAGLALAPQRCHTGPAVAKAKPVPQPAPEVASQPGGAEPDMSSWSSQTTLIKAGTAAGFAP